jgi:hypothetical protein
LTASKIIVFIRAGSRTTDSPAAAGLCLAISARSCGSVTVQPWNTKSPVSASVNTAGQLSPLVSGSIPMNTNRIDVSFS